MHYRKGVSTFQSWLCRNWHANGNFVSRDISSKNIQIDDLLQMCVSCCDQNYCNVNVPTNASNAIFDDKITRMRLLAKNLFKEREKALTTTIKDLNNSNESKNVYFSMPLVLLLFATAVSVIWDIAMLISVFYTSWSCVPSTK